MPTQKPTGARNSQVTGQQPEKQDQKLPSLRATIGWINPKDDENVRASGSLNIGGAFAVHGITVKNGPNGEFVSMPSFKKGNDYKDIFHPVTKEAREQMINTFMKAYEQKLAEQNQGEGQTEDEQSESLADDPGDEEGQVMNGM